FVRPFNDSVTRLSIQPDHAPPHRGFSTGPHLVEIMFSCDESNRAWPIVVNLVRESLSLYSAVVTRRNSLSPLFHISKFSGVSGRVALAEIPGPRTRPWTLAPDPIILPSKVNSINRCISSSNSVLFF